MTKTPHGFVKRSKTTRESVVATQSTSASSKSIVTTSPPIFELPLHPEAHPEPRKLPDMSQEIKEWADMYKTHNCDDDVLIDPHNLEGPLGKTWIDSVKLAGFIAMFHFGKGALALCCPSGRVLLFTRKESCRTFLIPDDLQTIMEDKYIRKVVMHQNDVVASIQPLLEFQIPGTSGLFKIVQAYTTKSETSVGMIKYFRQLVDSEAVKPPSGLFRSDDEDHLQFLIQGARATAFAVWFMAHRVTERIGFSGSRNLAPYIRFVLGFSDDEPAMSFLEDPYYAAPCDVEILDTHTMNCKLVNKLNEVNKKVWKKCRPGYNEPFNPKAIPSHCCRMCGFHESKMRNRDLAGHRCTVRTQCSYLYCSNSTLRHSIITCDALRGWCQNCQRRGHSKSDHARPGFNRFYAGFVFRKHAYFGHETGYVLNKPELARNPRHTRMTFYGLPSTLIPKVSMEAGLVPTDPNFEAPASNVLRPQKRSRSPSISHTSTKRQKVVPEVSLHRTRDGRIEKRTIIGGKTRPSMMASIDLSRLRTETGSLYNLKQLQSDLMTAQKISRNGTAGTSGSNMTESVTMILNVLEGERAYERSLIKVKQASTSEIHRYNDLIEKVYTKTMDRFSDNSPENSGNESNVSINEDESNVIKGESNTSNSSESEGDSTSRRNRPRGSSDSDHYLTETEDFLESGPSVVPAPEVGDLAEIEVRNEMDDDDVIETQANVQDMNLDASK